MMENKYSFWIGLSKSLKNWLVVMGIPMLVVLLDHYLEWMPEGWALKAAPVIAFVSYFIKNYIKNK